MPLPKEKQCGFCDKPPLKDEAGNDIKMKRCSRCKSVYYCDKECQAKHWKVHKKTCGNPSSSLSQPSVAKKTSRATTSSGNTPQTKPSHRSIDTVHQLVTRRFKELRKEGVPVQEAMKRARKEFQPSDDLDPGSKVAAMFGMRGRHPVMVPSTSIAKNNKTKAGARTSFSRPENSRSSNVTRDAPCRPSLDESSTSGSKSAFDTKNLKSTPTSSVDKKFKFYSW